MAMDRRDFLKFGGAGLAGAVLLGSTYGGMALAETGSLKAEFESAAQTYRVPVALLLAMGYVNTLWEMPPPSASDYEPGDLTGRGAYGILQLMQNPSTNTLGEAASLTGLSEDKLKRSRPANILGGAAVLADMQGEKPSDLNGWQGAVSEYGGDILYAVQVYETLQTGALTRISTGERVELAPQEDAEVPQVYTTASTPDYKRAVWRPAYKGNYTNANRDNAKINKLVVHVAQGSYSGTISWFKDRRANVSAHYVLSRSGKVAQCVRDADIAWHAGNWRYNKLSIGIEHEGYADRRKTWSDAMYHASARLAAHLSRRHNIQLDRKHVLEHRWVPGTDHYCPGKYFDYHRYLHLVRRYRRR